MKIHILTGHFYPQLHPRAFRASELAIELAKRGHKVVVTNLTAVEGADYEEYSKRTGVQVNNLGLYTISNKKAKMVSNSKWHHFKETCVEYFLSGDLYRKSRTIAKRISISEGTDAVIALSTPFMDVLAISKYIENYGKKFVTIADSGDPFYYSKQYKKAPWFYYVEKRAYRSYDYLTIPTENAIPSYAPLIDNSKIKIIPQGFRMDNLKLYNGAFDGPIRMAYAGVFYWDIRNPEFLFSYLNKVQKEFELYLFMRNKDALVKELLNKYPNVKKRVYVSSLPHDELIYELSRMHFLINIENISNTQMPSKLIDYGMAGRPILSCNSDSFSKDVFDGFMEGDYSGAYHVDVQKYNIVTIVDQFEQLIKDAK